MARPDIEAILARAEAATPGPWFEPEEGTGISARTHSTSLSVYDNQVVAHMS
jgi:hypothetical protein